MRVAGRKYFFYEYSNYASSIIVADTYRLITIYTLPKEYLSGISQKGKNINDYISKY